MLRKRRGMAKFTGTQYGGPDGELAAALRYRIKDIRCQMIMGKHF